VVVSPDAGGIKMAHAYSQTLEAELAIVAKRRKSATEVESMAVIGEIDGKNVFAGGRFDGNGRDPHLRGGGAEDQGGQTGHGLRFPRDFERHRHPKIAQICIDELITTDTVQRPAIDGVKITTLSVAGLLGEAIKRIHSNSSVNSLFEFKGGRTS
jgi:ribose-phosphate pyrophosphokinase